MFAFISRLVRGSIACALALAVAGCAGGDGGSDLTTQSLAENKTTAAAPVPAGKARLVMSRPSGMQYMAVAASVKVNGSEVASLYGGNTQTVDIATGNLTITVDASTYPGSWTEQLAAKAGTTYQIEVGPREGSGATAVLFGAIGGAIEAQNNPKSGLFQWTLTKQSAQVAAAPAAATAKQAKAAATPAKAAPKAAAAPKAE